MLALTRNLFVSSYQLKNGTWDKNGGYQLTNKNVGIIGCGNIGKEVIRLLKPFNCKIFVNDIIEQDSFYKENHLSKATKEEIYKECDIISIHTPLNKSTLNLFNFSTLKKCLNKPFIINSSRGGIVNEDDLIKAIDEEVICGAALDCYIEEPLKKEAL
jgi:D-3-phosphoglycerate dehydrogenase